MRNGYRLFPLCLLLTACGQANATRIDPKNDVHCSVLAFYFQGLAKHQGAPRKQQQATKGLHEWYAAKMRATAAERFKDLAGLEREISPLLEAVKADPKSMADKLGDCAKRAAADPGFDRFAADYLR